MASISTLGEKAKTCLAKQVSVPGAPLWQMANATLFDEWGQDNFQSMQAALDYLTCKARARMAFTADEKEFLKELYEAFYWGGLYKGYPEAALLADHYVNGNGERLSISAEVYNTTPIVQKTMSAMKKYIRDLQAKKQSFAQIRSDDTAFKASAYAGLLKTMNTAKEGKMLSSGTLIAPQNNQRLQKTDNRFHLTAQTIATVVNKQTKMKTLWFIDSIYDFEPFEKQDYYTEIPLGTNTLIVYDGLSEYMTQIGVAKAFHYRAKWQEEWE